jgi:hypothetical protein
MSSPCSRTRFFFCDDTGVGVHTLYIKAFIAWTFFHIDIQGKSDGTIYDFHPCSNNFESQ